MPSPIAASVVIVNYNGLRYLDTCLGSLFQQDLDGGVEVVLVDNASSDGSVAYVRSRWPAVKVVESDVNLGFAGGNNLGIGEAGGRHVVLLNNDTRVRPGWLRALVECAESDQRIGAVTSKLLFMARPGVIQNAGSLLLTDGSGGDRGTGEEDRGQYDRREEVFAACAGAALFTRPMLEDVGILDHTFFAYYEDTDLSWRMRLRGWHVVYEPAAVVEHVHSGTSVEWSPFFIFHVDRNRLFMILKNAPPAFTARAFAHFASLSVRSVGHTLLRRGSKAATDGKTPAVSGRSRARIHLRVVLSLLRRLPEMMWKRRQIRRHRLVDDAEIRRWFYRRELWDAR
ncbi:MAG: glycosyltransferase family 2 protein [Acidimicrobiaceae bacterium]|nr:glycosyltransferase family 2 protein [Acidimicrobiaceae bacterium]